MWPPRPALTVHAAVAHPPDKQDSQGKEEQEHALNPDETRREDRPRQAEARESGHRVRRVSHNLPRALPPHDLARAPEERAALSSRLHFG